MVLNDIKTNSKNGRGIIKNAVFAWSAAIFLIAFSGCQTPLTSSSYERRDARQMQTVYYGTVLAVNDVTIAGEPGAIGTIAGAAAGAAVGQTIGSGRGRTAATIIGGAAGAVAGGAAEKKITTKQGIEITVKLDDGRTVAVVQEKTPDEFFIEGDTVQILQMQDGTTRVKHP